MIDGRRVIVPTLVGPLHTVEGDDLPPPNADDPRFGTGLSCTVWVVIGPDPVLGEPWVLLHREGTDGTNHYDRRVERRK